MVKKENLKAKETTPKVGSKKVEPKTDGAKEIQHKIEVDKVNSKATASKVVQKRVLMYNYPKDCKTDDTRKKFRARVRKQIAKLESQITNAGSTKEKASLKKELADFKAEVHNPNYVKA